MDRKFNNCPNGAKEIACHGDLSRRSLVRSRKPDPPYLAPGAAGGFLHIRRTNLNARTTNVRRRRKLFGFIWTRDVVILSPGAPGKNLNQPDTIHEIRLTLYAVERSEVPFSPGTCGRGFYLAPRFTWGLGYFKSLPACRDSLLFSPHNLLRGFSFSHPQFIAGSSPRSLSLRRQGAGIHVSIHESRNTHHAKARRRTRRDEASPRLKPPDPP